MRVIQSSLAQSFYERRKDVLHMSLRSRLQGCGQGALCQGAYRNKSEVDVKGSIVILPGLGERLYQILSLAYVS